MDLSRLRTGEQIAGIAGIALIIVMFLSWWGAPEVTVETPLGTVTGGGGGSANAWEAADFMDIIWFLTGLAGIALALIAAGQTQVNMPVATSAITAGLGALSTVLILYRLVDPPFDASRKFGVFLGLICAAGVAYGGWLAMQEEGTTFGDQADRLRGGGDEPPPPPPPPSA